MSTQSKSHESQDASAPQRSTWQTRALCTLAAAYAIVTIAHALRSDWIHVTTPVIAGLMAILIATDRRNHAAATSAGADALRSWATSRTLFSAALFGQLIFHVLLFVNRVRRDGW